VSEPGTATASGTRAVDRAADLVSTVVRADEPLTFADLQESSGLAKSTASRMLSALERSGLLERDGAGSYVAGSLFWLYAARHDPWDEMVRLARPTMEQIGQDTHETVHLSVTRGDRAVQVAQVDSQYFLGTRDWTEVEVPAHCSALGKVFYAYKVMSLPDGELPLPARGRLLSRADLDADLAETVRRGWAMTWEELEEGLVAVAAPVRARDGGVVAAISVSGPTNRITESDVTRLGEQLAAETLAISRQLGYRPGKAKA
jgi:DNA-binding IclR family transcriptional regulator